MSWDFSGYATRNDIKCADGRTIRKDAFKDNDGETVPLVWMHQHNEPTNTLGHALLENRDDGVYTYGKFNDTENGRHCKELVRNGDVDALSIYANRLKQDGNGNVMHGSIREVSLVLAGANPGAYIDSVSLGHAEDAEIEEAVIYSGDTLTHSEDFEEDDNIEEETENEESDKDLEHSDSNQNDSDEEEEMANEDKTIGDVIEEMTDEQKQVLYYLVGEAANGGADEGDDDVKHNLFETDDELGGEVLTHDEMTAIFAEAQRNGSLKDAVLEHGIEQIDILFPEARNITPTPETIQRRVEWVSRVWNGLHKSPFARIKSIAANLTKDEARAKGYIKGNQKVEEQFGLLKRKVSPQTVYKLQKLDRDDIIDITDFDVVAWLKQEMRMMLDEELARAVLVGDGRSVGDNDRIDPTHIVPVYQDADTYTIHYTVDMTSGDTTDRANALVAASLRSRKNYMGSGNPIMLAPNDVITDMMLATDKMGRKLYATEAELAAALRVSGIVEVPVMEGVTRVDDDHNEHELIALILNLADYTIGADKGGEVNMFDDFDIDYNKYEYLIETRCSGALYKPYSAIALEKDYVPSGATGETGATGDTGNSEPIGESE